MIVCACSMCALRTFGSCLIVFLLISIAIMNRHYQRMVEFGMNSVSMCVCVYFIGVFAASYYAKIMSMNRKCWNHLIPVTVNIDLKFYSIWRTLIRKLLNCSFLIFFFFCFFDLKKTFMNWYFLLFVYVLVLCVCVKTNWCGIKRTKICE